jgi:hypothetical protein
MRQATAIMAAALAVAIAGCAGGAYVSSPPGRYESNTRFVGETHNPSDMPTVCKGAMIVGERGSLILGCFKDGVVHIPNPAANPLLAGQVLRHELGHVNAWPGTHPAS